ncbi:MAG: hypothetical protein WB615_05730, partial [Candidatus Tumulicola sp.]
LAPDAPVAEGVGCGACDGSGYHGRCGVFEISVMTPELRHAIESTAPPDVVYEAARRSGYEPLVTDARRLILGGDCSVEEAARVLGGAA